MKLRTLMVTTLDGVIVVDGIGKLFPEIMERDDDLLAISWDGTSGIMVYRHHAETLVDVEKLTPWFRLFDERIEKPDPPEKV